MKKQLYRAAAATVLGLSLTTGIAAAQTNGTIDTTGNSSYNKVSSYVHNHRYVHNDNDVDVASVNSQHAYSGDVSAWGNTTAGHLSTGSATNARTTSASLMVDNSASGGSQAGATSNSDTTGHLSNTGYGSVNVVKSSTSNSSVVSNDNDISVHSYNNQTATSGDARAAANTTVGNVSTGNVSNTSSETFVISVKN
jgi:hypothetical protein